MAREYTVKINVQSEKAAQQIEQFSAKALANIEKINKVEIKPKTTTKDVEVSLNRLQEASVRAATAETNRAAAADRAAATTARAHATEASALEKTKQKELDLEKATVQANARMEVQRMRLEQGQNAMHSFANATQNAVNQLKMLVGYAGATQMLRSALTEMKAMSDELVTYQKVTNATAEQMKQVRASAYESAKQYGQAPSDYLESVARMARAGYGQQAEAMANLATKTQLVGDMSAEMASKFLIAVDAGYRLNGNIAELEKVLNAANVADNNYATSLAEIAEGMTLIAPLAASMNISVEETTAAIGTMQALTQRSGTEVARAFRMIAINIAKDTETEVEEGFKLTQENVEDFNALLQEFAKEELAAAEASGKLLSPMKAIEAIAKAWKSGKLSEQQLFTVLNNIGGARYTNNIMALVRNFDVYQEMLGKFSTELTSADDEVAAMMDSWTRKLEVLKTSWVEMVNNRVSEDFIKSLLDIGIATLNWTGNLENLVTIGGGAIIVIKDLWAAIKAGSVSAIHPATVAIGALVAAIGVAGAAQEAYNRKLAEQSANAAKQAQESYDQAKALNDLAEAYDKITADGVVDETEFEEAKRLQNEWDRLVGDTSLSYETLTTKIDAAKEAIDKAKKAQQEMSLEAANMAVAEAESALRSKANPWYSSGIAGSVTPDRFTDPFVSVVNYNSKKQRVEEAEYLAQYLEGSLFQYEKALVGQSAYLNFTGDTENVDDLIKAGEFLLNLKEQIVKDYSGKGTPLILEMVSGALKNLGTEIENVVSARRNRDAIQNGDYSAPASNAGGIAGTGTASGADNAKEGAKAVDGYAESYNRLQAAIAAATTAQENFNKETSTTKGDQLKFYGSALEAYNEELKAGRVNSNAFHAAAKALMGEEAYNATGGYTQNVQAAMNATGSAGISLIEAITTLTAEYKNQEGQVREGAGLAVLLEKLGYNVKDSQGNYVVKMTEDMYKEVMAAIPGLTREMLENTANAYDQNDTKGRNTNLAPEETKSAEEQIAETNKETAQTNKETAETTKAAAETTTTAAETMSSAADTMSAAAEKFMAASDKSTEQEKADAEAAAQAAKEAEARAKATEASNSNTVLDFGTKPDAVQKLGDAMEADRELFKSELKAIESQNEKLNTIVDTVSGADQSSGLGNTLAAHKETWDAIEKLQQGADKVEEAASDAAEAVKKQTDWDKARTVQGAQEGMTHTQAQRTANKKALQGALSGQWNEFAGGKAEVSPSEVQDAKTAQEQQQKDVHEIAEQLRGTIDEHLQQIEKQQTHAAKKASIQEMRQSIKEGDVLGAFGGSQEWADKYNAVAGTYDPMKINGVIDEYLTATGVTVGANVEWTNNEATFNDVVIEVEAILDQYSANEVAAALEYLTDEEREAVIAAMVDKYSLAEVIASLDYVTNDKDRAAIIKAEVEKNGVQAVAAELNKLSAEKRIAYIGALVKSGDLATAKQLLTAMVGEKYAAQIIALLDQGSYQQALALLASLTAPATKTIYTQTVTTSGSSYTTPSNAVTPSTSYTGNQATKTETQAQARSNYGGGAQATPLYAVGTAYHPGGMALLNDGTGAELYMDSQGAHIANGKNALVNLEKGAKVYTAEQTRQMLNQVPHYALGTGSLSSQANYALDAGSSGVDPARVQQLVNELNGYFDSIHTGDTSYTQSGGSSGKSGSNTSTGKISSSGSGSSASNTEDERWKTLTSLIEYILKRLNKALEAQEAIIDKQIAELEERRSQSEQQNKLEELQKSVTEAQSNLQEAMSQRSVRYLGDDGQWHWMADQKKVNQAQEQLTNAQEALQDYLNDLVIDAQIAALEKEKQRLSEEYQGYTDLWSDILDAVDTPQGELVALINSLTASGTGAQKNGAAAVKSQLIAALTGGSYKKNYNEALGEIAKATANNPSVPGVSDNYLASLIASSGVNVSQGAMMDALQSIAGGGTLAGGAASQNTTQHADTYYMINGVQIGSDMADLPMSEVLRRLSVMTNIV